MTTNMINPQLNHRSRLMIRATLLRLVETALQIGSTRFARQATLSWLAYFPGDLEVKLLYGKAELLSGNPSRSNRVLSEICQADPEYLEAWDLLSASLESLPEGDNRIGSSFELANCHASIRALGGQPNSILALPSWSESIQQARRFLTDGDLDRATDEVHHALLADPLPPLVAVTHLHLAQALVMPISGIKELAGFYQDRFPGCILPILIQADALMIGGESDKAVAELHRAASMDVAGQIPSRLWGKSHPYLNLWPEELEAPLIVVPPAEVAAVFGWNKLPSASVRYEAPDQGIVDTQRVPVILEPMDSEDPDDPRTHSKLESGVVPGMEVGKALDSATSLHERKILGVKPIPESLRSVQSELERIASNLKRNQLARADGRFPIYVVLTTRAGLMRQYGPEGALAIDQELHRLVSVISASREWGAVLLYIDDQESTQMFSLSAAKPTDPWGIKLLLTDLDATLAKQGEMIAALLIVGGPEIVPFHLLPNPVDDIDADVPSDNPYATRDENYFIPEWPVGRLPGGCRSDPSLLITTLRKISDNHAKDNYRKPWYRRWLSRINPFRRLSLGRSRPSWGITAAIWRRASLTVFRPIGDPQSMSVSPPAQVDNGKSRRRKSSLIPPTRLGYFNLHGLEDASEWFGQRDPTEPFDHPDYPVALRPEDVLNGGRAPQLVFSEACYGANILEKSVEEALSLKFLASGSQGVVGSTCTSYGSITTPLIAADLLGHAFWRFLREGLPTGEALRRAKIHLAKEMHRRQGYLDGEDQKTLISFLLYGDPLGRITEPRQGSKSILRAKQPNRDVKIICDRSGDCQPAPSLPILSTIDRETPEIPAESMAQVKGFVEQYLPGFLDAEIACSRPKLDCSGKGHSCVASRLGAKSRPQVYFDHNVVTLRKQIKTLDPDSKSGHLHHHYARLTLDGDGKVIKMALSR